MNSLRTHDIASEEETLFKKMAADDILERFHRGELEYKGKLGAVIKVTSPQQAYAMAMAMSEKAWKRKQEAVKYNKLQFW